MAHESGPGPAASPVVPGPPPPYGPPLGLAAAKRVMAAAEAEAIRNGWPMVIAILDSGGHLVLLHRLDQANHGAIALAQRKAETAVNFRRATKVFEDIVVGGGAGIRMLSIAAELIALEGGVPLLEHGAVVGAIGVSGMQSFQDGQIAQAGARALANPSS
jgi:glc operon protein GlcG